MAPAVSMAPWRRRRQRQPSVADGRNTRQRSDDCIVSSLDTEQPTGSQLGSCSATQEQPLPAAQHITAADPAAQATKDVGGAPLAASQTAVRPETQAVPSMLRRATRAAAREVPSVHLASDENADPVATASAGASVSMDLQATQTTQQTAAETATSPVQAGSNPTTATAAATFSVSPMLRSCTAAISPTTAPASSSNTAATASLPSHAAVDTADQGGGCSAILTALRCSAHIEGTAAGAAADSNVHMHLVCRMNAFSSVAAVTWT